MIEREIERRDLYFAVGDRVVVTENLSTKDGIVNGSRGVVKLFLYQSISQFSSSLPPTAIGVEFDDKQGTVVMIPSKKSKSSEFVQLPLQLAYAQTVHKLQGATLEIGVIDMQSTDWQPRLPYVALSRVKTPESLLTLPLRNSQTYAKSLTNGISSSLQKEIDKNSQLYLSTKLELISE